MSTQFNRDFSDCALVLEGGGMRGVFTAGVLDYFIDKGITFPYNIGVSAGACNVLNYMAGQRGRTRTLDIDLLDKYKYIGITTWLRTGNIMNYELIFGRFPFVDCPFDFNAYFNNPNKCEVVACDCATGKSVFLDERKDPARLNDICRASCSLPFACKITEVDGMKLLDGGISDAIPFARAREMGYSRQVVILTRPLGYRKSNSPMRFPSFIYKDYPNLQARLRNKNFEYNMLMDEVEREERNGSMLVIRPLDIKGVGRLESDTKKLSALYDHGYECAERIMESIAPSQH